MNSKTASAFVSLIVFAVTYANRPAMILTDDAVPQMFIPWMVLRGHGGDFAPVIARYGEPNAPLKPYLTRVGDRVLSIYPYASAWLPLPISLSQFLYLDLAQPGWDRGGDGLLRGLSRVGKTTSAVVVAITAFLLHRLLIAWGFAGWSIPATLVGVLGSNLWMIASQATWQHGPAALCLTASLLALSPSNGDKPGRLRMTVAGLFAALLAAVRVPDALLSLVLAIIAIRLPHRGWFFIFPALVGTALVAWNLSTFGHLLGGQSLLAGQVAATHQVEWWNPYKWAEGILGTLISPNRGLLVFSPWCLTVAVACWACDIDWRARWSALGLGAFWLMVGSYPAWWAGHCFGPRYWTEAMPLFAAPLAWTFRWAWRKSSIVLGALTIACIWSIGVQMIGALYYPSTWNMDPVNVDLAHDRLWDWRDTELWRCLTHPYRPGQP